MPAFAVVLFACSDFTARFSSSLNEPAAAKFSWWLLWCLSPGQVGNPCTRRSWCQHEVGLRASWNLSWSKGSSQHAVQVLLKMNKTLVDPFTAFVFPSPPSGGWHTRAHPRSARVGWPCCPSHCAADPSVADTAGQHRLGFAGGETGAQPSQSGGCPKPDRRHFLLGLPSPAEPHESQVFKESAEELVSPLGCQPSAAWSQSHQLSPPSSLLHTERTRGGRAWLGQTA